MRVHNPYTANVDFGPFAVCYLQIMGALLLGLVWRRETIGRGIQMGVPRRGAAAVRGYALATRDE